MKVDLSRYSECPNCHTFQGNLRPCRKCGWHVDWNKKMEVPERMKLKASICVPGPKPKPRYKCRALALLRALEDGDYHPTANLVKKGIITRWAPKLFGWQAELIGQGVIDCGKLPSYKRRLCLWIPPNRLQDAKKLMSQLEDVEDDEDECR